MLHKCEYCDKVMSPCATPCHDFLQDKNHVCCTCPSESCELPANIVCDSSLCNLKHQVDWYKRKFEESQTDNVKMRNTLNQFRIANIGTVTAQELIDKGILDISGIKIFWAKQSLTWENIPIETGYILMSLHEEAAKRWASFLNEKAVKVQIKKELIQATEAKLKKAQAQREIKIEPKPQPGRVKREPLTPFEKIVFHNMKTMNISQDKAEEMAKMFGAEGSCRNLKELGYII